MILYDLKILPCPNASFIFCMDNHRQKTIDCPDSPQGLALRKHGNTTETNDLSGDL